MDQISVVVDHEEREDVARRRLTLKDAPRIEYAHEGYGRADGRRHEVRTMEPVRLTITWKRGQLSCFTLAGNRIKKDGTRGQLEADMRFRLEADGWQGTTGYGQPVITPPDWLLQLVEGQKDNVPQFNSPRDAE